MRGTARRWKIAERAPLLIFHEEGVSRLAHQEDNYDHGNHHKYQHRYRTWWRASSRPASRFHTHLPRSAAKSPWLLQGTRTFFSNPSRFWINLDRRFLFSHIFYTWLNFDLSQWQQSNIFFLVTRIQVCACDSAIATNGQCGSLLDFNVEVRFTFWQLMISKLKRFAWIVRRSIFFTTICMIFSIF